MAVMSPERISLGRLSGGQVEDLAGAERRALGVNPVGLLLAKVGVYLAEAGVGDQAHHMLDSGRVRLLITRILRVSSSWPRLTHPAGCWSALAATAAEGGDCC